MIRKRVMVFVFLLEIFSTAKFSRSVQIFKEFAIDLSAERHRTTHSEYCYVNTNIDRDYGEIPPKITITRQQIFGQVPCAVTFEVTLLGDRQEFRTVCLFKNHDSEVVTFDSLITIAESKVPEKDLLTWTGAVVGFIVNEPSSHVQGYIVKKKFYGNIRMYDKQHLYHIAFYIEPIEFAIFYGGANLDTRPANANAIIFEYLSSSLESKWLQACKQKIQGGGISNVTRGTPAQSHPTPAMISDLPEIVPPEILPIQTTPGPRNTASAMTLRSNLTVTVKASTGKLTLPTSQFSAKTPAMQSPTRVDTSLPTSKRTTSVTSRVHTSVYINYNFSTDRNSDAPRLGTFSTDRDATQSGKTEPAFSTDRDDDGKIQTTKVYYASTLSTTEAEDSSSTELSTNSMEPGQPIYFSTDASLRFSTDLVGDGSFLLPEQSTLLNWKGLIGVLSSRIKETNQNSGKAAESRNHSDKNDMPIDNHFSTEASTRNNGLSGTKVYFSTEKVTAAKGTNETPAAVVTDQTPVEATGEPVLPSNFVVSTEVVQTPLYMPYYSTMVPKPGEIAVPPPNHRLSTQSGHYFTGELPKQFAPSTEIPELRRTVNSKHSTLMTNDVGKAGRRVIPYNDQPYPADEYESVNGDAYSYERAKRFVYDETVDRMRRSGNKPLTSENSIKGDDVGETIAFSGGTTSTRMFDLRRENAMMCDLCIWIQPNFAEKFGLGGGVLRGLAEVIDIISFLNWTFRTIDFNQDGFPENIGFRIKRILLSDNIAPATRRKRRSNRDYIYGPDDSIAQLVRKFEDLDASEFDMRFRRNKIETDFDEYDTEMDDGDKYAGYETKDGPPDLADFSRKVESIPAKTALQLLESKLSRKFQHCCATLAFIYHDMAPVYSVSNKRALCGVKNIAVISGYLGGRKIGKYDVFRGVMHALGHLFGASHDIPTDVECLDDELADFVNPYSLHLVQQVNIGLRPNSMGYSACAKDSITMFLASSGASCLKPMRQPFCGDGIIDIGEDCDCGSPWQCHSSYVCCGERETFFGCKAIHPNKFRCPSIP